MSEIHFILTKQSHTMRVANTDIVLYGVKKVQKNNGKKIYFAGSIAHSVKALKAMSSVASVEKHTVGNKHSFHPFVRSAGFNFI